MNKEHLSKEVTQHPIWTFPWKYREGFIIAFTWLLIGFLLQIISKGISFSVSWPVNIIVLASFLAIIALCRVFIKQHPIIRWLSSVPAAISVITAFVSLVFAMGFIKQDVAPNDSVVYRLGLHTILQSWPYVLSSVYMITILTFTVSKRLFPFNLNNIAFFLNHAGLLLVLLAASLGLGDAKKYYMVVRKGETSWTAFDNAMKPQADIPFAIYLVDFRMEEYPPELVLFNHKTGTIQVGIKDNMSCDDTITTHTLGGYNVHVLRYLAYAKEYNGEYFANNSLGAVHAAKVSVTKDAKSVTKWLSYSNTEPSLTMTLNDSISLGMTIPSAKKFISDIKLYTPDQQILKATIEVNHPLKFRGWEVYQVGYDNNMGRWSNSSTFELVCDPWIKAVYTGIFMLFAGSILLFFTGKKKF